MLQNNHKVTLTLILLFMNKK